MIVELITDQSVIYKMHWLPFAAAKFGYSDLVHVENPSLRR